MPGDKTINKMRDIRVEKMILNIAVGESGDRLTRASRVLKQLTGQEPLQSKGECAGWTAVCGYVVYGCCCGGGPVGGGPASGEASSVCGEQGKAAPCDETEHGGVCV